MKRFCRCHVPVMHKHVGEVVAIDYRALCHLELPPTLHTYGGSLAAKGCEVCQQGSKACTIVRGRVVTFHAWAADTLCYNPSQEQ